MDLQVELPFIRIVGDIVPRVGTMLGPRHLDEFELLYFPDGSNSKYTVNGVTHSLREPSFIISRPDETHTYEYDSMLPSRHLFIHFRFVKLPNLEILQNNDLSCIPLQDELYYGMMKQILYIAYSFPERIQERGSTLLLALLEEINGFVVDQPTMDQTIHMPSQISKALEYMEEHLSKSLTMEELATSVGWTHEHFSRVFAQHTGVTPREMMTQRRIEKACQYLLYKNWNVKQVAYSVGFTDENYFYKTFKKLKGMTAKEYRQKYYNPRYSNVSPIVEGHSLYPLNRVLYNIGADNQMEEERGEGK